MAPSQMPRTAGGATPTRSGRRGALGLVVGLAAAAVAVPAVMTMTTAFAPAFGGSWPAVGAGTSRGEAVVRRARNKYAVRRLPGGRYYSNADRERLARQRSESRLARREQGLMKYTAPIDYNTLPAVEDIYNRRYSGKATEDPIGGRKRYTYYILYKEAPGVTKPDNLKKKILEFIAFLRDKMSCRDIKASLRKSPIDSMSTVSLEYPMKEYGEIPRGQKEKRKFNKAKMVEFQFYAPVSAGEYISKKIYSDIDILRFMVLGHTRTFKHVGEDNELHL